MLCKKITSPRLLELLPHHSTILSHQPTALSWGTLQKSNKRSISFHHYHDRIRVTRPWIPFWHLQIIISARTRSRLPSFSITTPQKTVSRPGSATLRRYLRSGGQIRLGETSTTASPHHSYRQFNLVSPTPPLHLLQEQEKDKWIETESSVNRQQTVLPLLAACSS